ncbi:MAG TPA: hypothetical protein VGF48_12630 [Thermoanaerobaculia bacterium]|jgi:hypothetical protein
MKRIAFCLALIAAACGEPSADSPHNLSRQPLSVRGWIEDVEGAERKQIPDLEIARRTEQFINTSLWVEGSQYASGGVAENGAFLILDVPPNNVTIGIQAPGADGAQIVLQNVPGSADVLIPGILLRPGGVRIIDPNAIRVRVPSNESKARPTGQMAIVAGHQVRVIATPLRELNDRRDYPNPGGFRPVATVK